MPSLHRARLLPSLLVLSVVSTHVPAFAQTTASGFSDVRTTTPYATAIGTLKMNGVVEGYGDGSFKPNASINRAEFLKIVLEGRSDDETFAGSNCFPDVRTQWFAPYICFAQQEGIIEGYPDGTFKQE